MANDLNQCGDSKKRTPDEIKKGLECCRSRDCAGGTCPYYYAKSCSAEKSNDAFIYIQQLEAQVPHWISVEERLPEELKDVLVYRDGCFAIARIITGDDWTYCGMGGDPTHWMPLPEPPKEG